MFGLPGTDHAAGTRRNCPAVGRALRPGGLLYLRTDDMDYDAQMREVCAACPELKPAETPAELAAFITDFERHFLAAGQKTRHLAYERTVHS